MATNPRKFSEKIALHTQKQAEETAAFEQIMREVMGATRETKATVGSTIGTKSATGVDAAGGQGSGGGGTGSGGTLLNIPEPRGLGSFRGGSLPNVAQEGATARGGHRSSKGSANSGSGGDSQIDLAGALNSLECMKRGDVSPGRGRSHHRQRSSTASSHQRYDVSPYSSSNYLPIPHDSNWRRTNSDSAINQSPSRDGSFRQAATSPSHRRSTVNSCSQSEVMQQLGIYPSDCEQQAQCRPRSAEVGTRGPMGYAQHPSPSHLSPPLTGAASGGMAAGHSGSLPDLTILHFAQHGPLGPMGGHGVSSHVSGVTSLDGSPESVYSDFHDFHDCQGSPVRHTVGAGTDSSSSSCQQQALHNGSNGSCAGGRLTNPQVSPPRITVEGLTLDTIALSLNSAAAGGNASSYTNNSFSPEGSPCSPLASAPSSPLGCQSPSQGVSTSRDPQMDHDSLGPTTQIQNGSSQSHVGSNGSQAQHHSSQSLNTQQQQHPQGSPRLSQHCRRSSPSSPLKTYYEMTPVSNNITTLSSGVGNGSFRVQQQQQQHHPLHQTVSMNGGIAESDSIYDTYYENLVELNKLNQTEQASSQTADSLQGYYSDSTGGLQSPGSAGIPDIILTEPGASLDECSNNSSKVLSSSVGSGGQYFTPSPSPTGSPLPLSPHHEMQQSMNSNQGDGMIFQGGADQMCPTSGVMSMQTSSTGLDQMIGFDVDLFQGDQAFDLDGLQLLPEQEAAIMAAVGGAQGFTTS